MSATVTFNFAGKTALVTGSTVGIGFAIAEAFYKAGANVLVNGRDAKKVELAIERLQGKVTTDASKTAHEIRLFAVVGDVGTKDGSNAIVKQVEAISRVQARTIDYLICNVGIFAVKAFETVTDDEWLEYFNVNVMGCVRLCRHYLPQMLRRNSGRIILVSSETGFRPIPQMLHYSVSKAAQISLARGLAELTHGTKVTVNSLLPGPTLTEGLAEYLRGRHEMEVKDCKGVDGKKAPTLEEFVATYCKLAEPTSIIERLITVKEVADTTLFLCSDAAAAINGHAQRVEGGIIRCM